MAVAIPLLLTATGASAAIGAAIGVSAAMVTVGVGVAMAVTGVSAKIDKAAAGVFGEDIVALANVAGMAYGMTDGFGTGAMSGGSGLDGAVQGTGTAGMTEAGWNAGAAANEAALASVSGAPVVSTPAVDAGGVASFAAGESALATANQTGTVTGSATGATRAAAPTATLSTAPGSAGAASGGGVSNFLGRLTDGNTMQNLAGGALRGLGDSMTARAQTRERLRAEQELINTRRSHQREDQDRFNSGSGLSYSSLAGAGKAYGG